MFRSTLLTALSCLLFFCSIATTQQQALGQSAGIAANYPGDVGIEKDKDVVFVEQFEAGSLQQIAKRWGHANNKNNKVHAFSKDVPPGSVGGRSMQMTGVFGENSGGDLYTTFKPGLEKAHVRFYTKFAADHGYEHHFVALGGYNPSTPWPNPKAGSRPNGDDRLSIFIDPVGFYGRYPPPGVWTLYSYWSEMKISADGKYWGNVLAPVKPTPVKRDRWICVELMIALNSTPEKHDGRLTLWIDGEKSLHVEKGVRRGLWSGMGFNLVESGGTLFKGLKLRTSKDLKINHLWLEHYVDPGAQRQNRVREPSRVNRVWFDHVVVAKSYIGPIARRRVAGVERSEPPDATNPGGSQNLAPSRLNKVQTDPLP